VPTPIRTIKDLKNKIRSDVFSSTSGEIDPSQDPFYNAVTESLAKTLNSVDTSIRDSFYETFPQTAVSEEALSLISLKDTNNRVQRKPAKFSSGEILAIASESVDIPVGTQFITQDGNIYQSIVFRTCVEQTIPVSSLQRVNNYAIATIPSHNLGNLMNLTISGANEVEFNGNFEIQIVDKDTIKWVNEGSDESATGTISAAFLGTRVTVQSVLDGENTAKDFNTTIDLSSNLPEITATFVTFNGIIGGADTETLASWKTRLNEYFAFPENLGNIYYLNFWIKQNTNANYCYNFNSEDSLYLYLTSVVSKLDDEYNFTNFTLEELSAIRSQIIAANRFSLSGVDALQFQVVNPTFSNINISIADLSPDSVAMRAAISAKMKAYIALLPIKFFLKNSQLSVDKIRSLLSTVRDSTGRIPSFGSVNVTGLNNLDTNTKKPVLGNITY